MTSAFISYQHEDRPVATYVAAQLESKQGVSAFIDYQKLRGGEFRKRLGEEVVNNDYFVVLVSPRSIESQEVRYEINLALAEKPGTHIIPFLIEEIESWKNVYPLLSFERVQLQFNSSDNPQTGRSMQRAIKRLEELMEIQDIQRVSASHSIPDPRIFEEAKSEIEFNGEQSSDQHTSPEFSDENIDSLFESALAIQSSDPVRAMFLYQLVIDIDPDYLNGGVIEFVERQRVRTKPHRLQLLNEQVEIAKRRGYWIQLAELVHSMLEIDPENAFALRQAEIAKKNMECEPSYKHARIAHENGNQTAVHVLMRDILDTCPDYGDPASLLANQPISRDLAGYVRSRHTLAGHHGSVICVAFSNNGKLLASASADNSVKVWTVDSGNMLFEWLEHGSEVNAVVFSNDDRFIASASADGYIYLVDVQRQEPVASVWLRNKLNDLAFSVDDTKLVTCSSDGQLHILDVPNLDVYRSRRTYAPQDITSLAFAGEYPLYSSAVEWNTDDRYASNSIIRLWDIRNSERIKDSIFRLLKQEQIHKITVSYDCKFIASVGLGVDVFTLPQAWSHCKYFDSNVGPEVNDVTFSPVDFSLLVLAGHSSYRGKIFYYDLVQKQVIHSQEAHKWEVNSIAISRDGCRLATGSSDYLVKIWQL